MILLDTNVVSEPLRPDPSGRVVEWLDAQALEAMFLPVIAVAELRYGIEVMPAGRRREALAERIEGEVLPLFINRVLPVDVAVTASFAKCMATARLSGVAASVSDGLIAAIAIANNLSVATRDIAAFEAMGAAVINPWSC